MVTSGQLKLSDGMAAEPVAQDVERRPEPVLEERPMTFTDLFVRRPVLAPVVSTLILLFGALALSQLPIRQYPLLENSTITISTDYPGASSERCRALSRSRSRAVSSVEGVDYLSSSSVQGRSVVTVRMALNRDSTRALTEVMAKVNPGALQAAEQAYDPVIERSAGESRRRLCRLFQ